MNERVDDEGRPLPVFPGFAEVALARRRLLRELAERRGELGLSQTVVAARMGTSQSVVARLESGKVDARLSTMQRYAAALGRRLEWRLSEE
ncbi:MAG: helix-turn-helix domain-containing protein [Egibacteraceae bacterium]